MSVFEFFLSTDHPITRVFNPLIWAITALAIAQIVWAFRAASIGLRQDMDAVESASGAEGGRLAAALDLSAKSPVRARFEHLNRLKERGVEIDSELLIAISSEHFRTAAPIARWALSVLVLLGLAGTLLGLGVAVSSISALMPEPGSDTVLNSTTIVNSIVGTLGGMRIAFSTTLSGVFGAVVVGSGMVALRQTQSAGIRRMEALSSTTWAPEFDTTDESRFSDVVEELAGVKKGFGELVAATQSILGEAGAETPSLAEYVETVQLTTQGLAEAVEAVSEMLPEIQASLEETIKAEHTLLHDVLTQHTSKVEPLLEAQQKAATALAAAVKGEVDRIEEIKEVLARLNESLEGAKGTWERADKSISRMEVATAGALREGFRDALGSVKLLTDEQSRSQRRVTEALDAFQATNRQTMASLADASNRALAHSQEVVSEIRSTLQESLEQVGVKLIESQRGTSDQMASGLSKLGRELRDLAHPVRPPGREPASLDGPGQSATPDRAKDPSNDGRLESTTGEGLTLPDAVLSDLDEG